MAEPNNKVAVMLPSALVALFPGAGRRLIVDAATVSAAIDAVDARWPGMGDRIRDSRPSIRRHINIFVAGERAGLDTPVPAGGEIIVMTAISGG